MAPWADKIYLRAAQSTSRQRPVEGSDTVSLDFLFQVRRRSGQSGPTHKAFFSASVALDVNRSIVPDRAAIRVLLMDFQHLDINRGALNSGYRLAHRKLRFPIEFIEENISENRILENPSLRFDVVDGILFVNWSVRILLNFGRDRCPGFNGRQGLTASAAA
ncbi:hypothetical protein [Neorhizobium sp. T25_27]|uniref:hypothetical protein n=1 Tax=Neorhizobium sp. T25_27 TaxID=2093831 RepID=UPI00155EA4BF|nr:hypothetical protein [Neorhizobium sp. T25_27]